MYSRPSNIYLLKITDGKDSWLKLGHAAKVDVRISGYGLDRSFSVTKIFVIPFETRLMALHEEKRLHNKYKKVRLPPTQQEFYMDSGFTECYPVEIQEELILDLIKIGGET